MLKLNKMRDFNHMGVSHQALMFSWRPNSGATMSSIRLSCVKFNAAEEEDATLAGRRGYCPAFGCI